MRNISCNFTDEIDLQSSIVNSDDLEQVTLRTTSSTKLRVLERVSVRLNVNELKATNKVLGRIVRRKPMLSEEDHETKYEYTVRLDPSDKIWFNAFVDEVQTLSKFSLPL